MNNVRVLALLDIEIYKKALTFSTVFYDTWIHRLRHRIKYLKLEQNISGFGIY
jgi:hypothetical protein